MGIFSLSVNQGKKINEAQKVFTDKIDSGEVVLPEDLADVGSFGASYPNYMVYNKKIIPISVEDNGENISISLRS